MPEIIDQAQKAELFRQLHHTAGPLLLPNIWDPLGAALLQDLGFPAVATSSGAVALTQGRRDGEQLPFAELLAQLRKITAAVSVPVSADIEKGYASTDEELAEHIEALIGTGIAGVNIEDSEKGSNALLPMEDQARRITVVRQVAERMQVPLFINARVDCYVHADNLSHAEKVQETQRRAKAYLQAGADGIFPILLKDPQHIQALVEELDAPLNIMAYPGIPELKVLHGLGVRRISLGSSFLKVAVRAMQDFARKLQRLEGTGEITANPVTSDYLNALIGK
jgi:2-methylisocitrate lyase-like PEP mutase family enzyme